MADNQTFLSTDEIFLKYLSIALRWIGVLSAIYNLLYLFFPYSWLYFFHVKVWGNLEVEDAAFSNLNLGLALLALGVALALKSKLGWWIAQILLILLSVLFIVLITLFISNCINIKSVDSSNPIDISHLVEATLTNICFALLSIGFSLYLWQNEVKALFNE